MKHPEFLTSQSILYCRKNTFSFITIAIIVLLIYSNNYNASWHFDDEPNIILGDALHLKELKWAEIKKTFFWDTKLYRPIACFSLALNYFFGQENVFGYHLINNLIHIVSAIFLFLFIHHTLNLPSIQHRYGKNSYNIALLAALLWAINPIQTQAITYIVQRMASMAGMFYIMAMYFYLKGRTASKKSSRIYHLLLCLTSACLSLGSKENSIMLPVTLLVYEILLIQGTSFREWFQKNRKVFIIFLIGSIIIAIIYLQLVRGGGIFSFMGGYERRTFNLTERLLTEPRVIIFYITQLLYPMPNRLSVNHDFSLSYSLFNPPSTLLAILLICCFIIGAFIISRRWPFMAFSIFFFFLNHIVESSFIPLELIFEHRNYIPSMLFFVPFSFLIIKLIDHFSKKKIMYYLLVSFFTLVIISLGHSTYIRNFTWRNEESLWVDCIEKYPDLWRPHHNLARYYEKNYRFNDAMIEYKVALSQKNRHNKSEEVLTAYNLGLLYQIQKDNEMAMKYFDVSERINPSFAPTYVNKGLLFLDEGLFEEALSAFQRAIELDKNLGFAYSNLGFLQLILGEIDNAINNLKLAIQKGDVNSKTYRHLGHAYRIKGLNGMALMILQKSRELDINDPIILLHLAELYASSGMTEQSDETLDKFFFLYQENSENILKLFKDLSTNEKVAHAILPPNTSILFDILVEKCQNSAQIDQELADYLINKKSELASKPVHFSKDENNTSDNSRMLPQYQ